MKQKDKQKIINNLKLPDSFLKQNCCAYQVIKHESGCAIINGFYIDSTDMKDAFFLQYFTQCLFIPFVTFSFNLGDRIGSYWTLNSLQRLQSEIERFTVFDRLLSFEDFIRYATKHNYYGNKVAKYEDLACSLFAIDKMYDAKTYLLKMIHIINKSNDNWYDAEKERAQFLLQQIQTENRISGIEKLLLWQETTINNLGIII